MVTENDPLRIIIESKKRCKRFLWKELSVSDVVAQKTSLYTFTLDKEYTSLTEDDKKGVEFLQKWKHGLDFQNEPTDLPSYRIFPILKGFIRDCRRGDDDDDDDCTITFKGGLMEKQLLERSTFHRYIDLNELVSKI